MTKAYLQFGNKPKRFAAMPSRVMKLRNHGAACFRSDGGEGEDEEEKEVRAIQEIGKQVEAFKNLLGEKADAEAFKAVQDQVAELAKNIKEMEASKIMDSIEAINKANETFHKQIVEMQEAAMKTREAEEGRKTQDINIKKEDVKKFIDATFKDGKKTAERAEVVIKNPEIFGYATFFDGGNNTDVSAFTGRFVDPTLYQRKRKRNLILDLFDIRTIGVPRLLYLVKVEEGPSPNSQNVGGAAWILSGEQKPLRSFRVTTGEAEAKKIAIFGTVEDKLLRDVDSLERWLREDFMDELREGINDGLLNNNPGVNPKAPLGLKTEAIQFTATPAYDETITDPNYIDGIFALIARMRYNREEPGVVIVSTDVDTRIRHLKDNEDRYQNNNLIYTNNLGQLFISGVPIYAADEEDIPSTHVMILGADRGFKIYAYGPMVFERGLNGEDFRYDRTSYRGYQEFLSFVPTHREDSVLYDTWDNIFGAIAIGS